MNLTNRDGSVTDSNNLPDIDSMILEKAEELRKLCSDNDRQFLIMVGMYNKTNKLAYNWKVVKKASEENTEAYELDVSVFFNALDDVVNKISNNQLQISKKDSEE